MRTRHSRIISQGHLESIMMYGKLNCTRSSALKSPRITAPSPYFPMGTARRSHGRPGDVPTCTRRSSGPGYPRITAPSPSFPMGDRVTFPLGDRVTYPISEQYPRRISAGHLEPIMMYGKLNCTRSSGLACHRITAPSPSFPMGDRVTYPISKQYPRRISQGHLEPS